MDEAEVLREDRVDPDAGAAVEETIEKAADRYRAVYGVPDLPERPPVKASDLPLTIDQKLRLARQLRAVAERAPTRDEAAALVTALETRKTDIEALPVENRDGLDLVEEYPDHPEAEAALENLLTERLPFWALPSKIRRTRSAIEEYRDYLPRDKVEGRIEELEDRASVFELRGEAAVLVLFGIVSFLLAIPGYAGLALLGVTFLVGGAGVQYLGIGDDSTGEKPRVGKKSATDTNTRTISQSQQTNALDGGCPAGTWRCPKCGDSKRKKEGSKVVPCQKCGADMQFAGEKEDSSSDASVATDRESPSDSGYPAGVWKCPDCKSRREKGEGFKRVICRQCGSEMEFESRNNNGKNRNVEKGNLKSYLYDSARIRVRKEAEGSRKNKKDILKERRESIEKKEKKTREEISITNA